LPFVYSYLSADKGSTLVARHAGKYVAIAPIANMPNATVAKIIVSVGVTPNNNDAITRVKPNDAATPTNTQQRNQDSMSQDQFEYVGPLGAQRHAHSNFMCALGYRIGHDAINSDRRQHERQNAKESTSSIAKRCCAIDVENTSFMLRILVTGMLGSTE
jgi:hypothetical protein